MHANIRRSLKFSIPKCYDIQINTIRQSITQLLFYIQWYICQGLGSCILVLTDGTSLTSYKYEVFHPEVLKHKFRRSAASLCVEERFIELNNEITFKKKSEKGRCR